MNLRKLLCVGALFLAPCVASAGDVSDENDRNSDCFYQNQVRHYQVVDDEHITVEISNNRYFVVELWRPVRNLDNTRQIAFQSATNRVCSRFSEVLVDGGVRIRSIRQISEDERDALLTQGERIDDAPVNGADIEDLAGTSPEQDERR